MDVAGNHTAGVLLDITFLLISGTCCCFLLALSLKLQSHTCKAWEQAELGHICPISLQLTAVNGSSALVVLKTPLVLELCMPLYRKEAFITTTTFSGSGTNARLLQ